MRGQKKILFSTFFMLTLTLTFSQYKQLDSIQQVIQHQKSYFDLVRETIHLDLNKDTYLVQDEIWFKAYVMDRNTQKPFPITANLYVALYNSKGDEILKQLFYTENGLSHGSFKIPKTLETGFYTIAAYTAYQNNFEEDELFKQEITILNSNTEIKTLVKSNNTPSYDIQVLPEGGHLISENINVCGVKVLNEQGNGVSQATTVIYDSTKNEIVYQCKVNQFGLGKISFTPRENQQYHMMTKVGEDTIKTILPKVKSKGVILNTSMHPNKELLVITLKTNAKTLPEIRNRNFYLLIHQNQKIKTLTTSFIGDQLNIPIAIPLEELNYGANTVTLFSEDMMPLAERLVFNHTNSKQIKSKIIAAKKNQDSVQVTLKAVADTIFSTSLSVSILPVETVANGMDNTIVSSLYLKPYLNGTVQEGAYYFGKLTPKKRNDLDLLLLTQGWSKYSWHKIFRGKPEEYYPHENGIVLKGTVNNVTSLKTNLIVTSPENELLEIMIPQENKPITNFILENRKLLDSSKVGFSITNKKGETLSPNVTLRTNALTKYKSGGIKSSSYYTKSIQEKDITVRNFRNDMFSSAEELEEVLIVSNKPEKRKSVTGRTISARDRAYLPKEVKLSLKNLGKYLQNKFFTLKQDPKFGNFGFYNNIIGRKEDVEYKTYVDDALIISVDVVQDMSLANIQDIYIVEAEYGIEGSIFVFTKENLNQKQILKEKFIINGFQEAREFYVPKYRSVESDNFKKYGVIGWSPIVKTDVNGIASFNFQNVPEDEIKMFIEGMDTQGNLVSEVKILTLPK